MTIDDATSAFYGQTFFHHEAVNADGTALRCRVSGSCKTWKTRPDDFQLPVKHGLKQCFYLTPRNRLEWLTYDRTLYHRTAS